MADNITYEEVYEIAAEVAEETVKKFLKNLVKLVPIGEDVAEDLREQQYKELKQLRKNRMTEQKIQSPVPIRNVAKQQNSAPIIPMDDDEQFYEDSDDEFANIAHPTQSAADPSLGIDDALSQIPLERSDLFGEAANSAVDNSSIVPMNGLDV